MKMSYWAAPGQFILATAEVEKVVQADIYFNPDDIKQVILSYFSISVDQLRDKDRHKEIVYARHFMHYFLKIHGKMYLRQIGEYLGSDHTTVMHGRDTIKDQLGARGLNKYKEDYYRIYLLLNAQIDNNVNQKPHN